MENISQESDQELWDILTNENAKHDKADITDSDEEIEGNDSAVKKEQRESVFPCPKLLHGINGTSLRPGKVLNIAPCENQIPVSFTQEPDWEALAFVKEFPLGAGHFNEERNVRITLSQYIHARLKNADDHFASNASYVFHELDMIERAAILSYNTFAENKRFQDNVTAGQANSSCYQINKFIIHSKILMVHLSINIISC